jgi:hypothetical protein
LISRCAPSRAIVMGAFADLEQAAKKPIKPRVAESFPYRSLRASTLSSRRASS